MFLDSVGGSSGSFWATLGAARGAIGASWWRIQSRGPSSAAGIDICACLWPRWVAGVALSEARALGHVGYASLWPRTTPVGSSQRRREPLASSAVRASGRTLRYHSVDGESPWPRQLPEPLATRAFFDNICTTSASGLVSCAPRQLCEHLASQCFSIFHSTARAPGLASCVSLWPHSFLSNYSSVHVESPWPRQLREPLAA